MLVVKCPLCGKRIIWDDFQPTEIVCPQCGERLDLHRSFKKNIELREMAEGKKIRYCPHCSERVSRLWFIKCRSCGYWLFGPITFHGKWPFILALIAGYLALTLYYVVYVR
ncbi:MAG: hypothetical protein ACP5G0_07715 [Desulfomonilia bacterium]